MADEIANFRFVPEAIGHVLQDLRLSVPIYQRSFSWGNEQIEELLEDVRSAFAKPNSEYFLGNIVLSLESMDSTEAVIGGQRRLATITLLLASIRNVIKRRDDEKRAGIIHNKFLSIEDLETASDRPR